jgi:hypothetical protein
LYYKGEYYAKTLKTFCSNLSIANGITIFLKEKKEIIEKSKHFIIKITKRSFIFACKDSSIYICLKISITQNSAFFTYFILLLQQNKYVNNFIFILMVL